MPAKIRKIVTLVEEVRSEMGRAVDPPTRRAAAIAVIENPFAGRYVEDLTDLMIDRQRTRRAPDRAGRCGARHPGRQGRELRQGGARRRGW